MTQFLQSKFSTYGKTCFGCTQRDEWLHRQQEEIDSLKEELNYLQRENVGYKKELLQIYTVCEEVKEEAGDAQGRSGSYISDLIPIANYKGDLIDTRV